MLFLKFLSIILYKIRKKNYKIPYSNFFLIIRNLNRIKQEIRKMMHKKEYHTMCSL